MRDWPQTLTRARGPLRQESMDGGRTGMGAYGPVTCSLHDEGFVPAESMAKPTLFILSSQPRNAADREAMPGGGGEVADGVLG